MIQNYSILFFLIRSVIKIRHKPYFRSHGTKRGSVTAATREVAAELGTHHISIASYFPDRYGARTLAAKSRD